MKKWLVLVMWVSIHSLILGQESIFIDGIFTDWDDKDPVFVDNSGDGQNNGIDIKKVWVHNDQSYLYFRFELTKEINLQEGNEFAIYIDYDNNINTGFKINGIGAEVRYFFGERFGVIQDNNDFEFVNFLPVGMLVAPSVSSNQFEISMAREINDSGINISAQSTIAFRLEDNSFNGDEAPDDLEGILYDLDMEYVTSISDPQLEFPSSGEFRLMSYNIENDQLFDPARRAAFERIFKATQPDIIAFQEIRDFNSLQTKNLIEQFLPGEEWFHKKHGFDIVTISKYPINFSQSVDGNAAFYLNMNGEELVLINCHLPCCENDNDRQTEVDIIMEYIRDLKEGQGDYNVEEGTPIIIAGDMNFVGDSNQPYTFLTGDILNNGFYGPDFSPDWDETDLADANPYATNSFGNFTWINENGSFFPGKLDWVIYTDSRLSLENSYALYTPGLTSELLQEFNLQSSDAIFASDHLPIITDFAYSTVNVDEIIDVDVKLFPNPASHVINIQSTDNQIVTIKLFDMSGRAIEGFINVQNLSTIDISSLKSGSYFLLIEFKNGRIMKPFLKVR